MDKKEILDGVKQLAKEGALKRSEVLECFEGEYVQKRAEHGISKILYWIGGGVVFLGILIFASQYWESFNNVTKVLVALGAGIAAYLSGVLFFTRKEYAELGMAFHLIGALLLPFGLGVLFEVSGISIDFSSLSLIFFALSGVYLATFAIYRKTLFLFFSILFLTLLLFSFTSFIIGNAFFADEEFFRFLFYRVFAVGISFMFLGRYFSKDHFRLPAQPRMFSGALYGFGALGFLGSALLLGGWEATEYPFWNIIYPALLFIVLYLAPYLKTRSFLVFGVLFLVLYIFKMTGVYFAGSIGWPVALVFIGFALIGVAYLTVYLDKRFKEEQG